MASAAKPLTTTAFSSDLPAFNSHFAKSIPILPSSSAPSTAPVESMDVTPNATTPMGPPAAAAPAANETNEATPTAGDHQQGVNGGTSQPVGAAAAAQQPKVVQTAFIHKLYNMLEDQSIQHLISWSSSNESFVMSPSSEFSKVLAQYFKHTNISSFVRQLNMYGFHKVSDVFHTGSPETPLWEFKHGAGNFKRGDLSGLREIKRRASRHALIHRDSFSNAPKVPPMPQPGTPMDMPPQDPIEGRLTLLEWTNNDLITRLARHDETYTLMAAKCQALLEGLTKCHQWNQELCSHLLALVPDPENPVHRDVALMRQDVNRSVEQLRTMAEPQEPLFPHKPSFFQHSNNVPMELPLPIPLSPRQRPFDESRRPSLQPAQTPTSFRTTAAPPAPMSPRRYGSIGTASGAYSPAYNNRASYLRPPPPPPAIQEPLPDLASPHVNLTRRHTSADIRVHGWQGGNSASQFNQTSSPYASGESSSAWPSSPRHAANAAEHQHIRDAFANYELPRATQAGGSRQTSPPPPHETGAPSFNSSFGGSYANTNDSGWQLPGARFPFKGLETPGAPSRRSSMASNVHSLLNPADTAEREGEDEGPDERKRKRLQ